jgi:hypothetical protein
VTSASAAVRASLVVIMLGAVTSRAEAQAWVPPARTLSIDFVAQVIDHSGHILDDGSLLPDGKSTTAGLEVIVWYALTDRLSVSAGVPYVFAKYRGPGPTPFVFLPVDRCFCFHGGLQDVSATVHFNAMATSRGFALTPSVAVSVPSWNYNHVGEAVVGRHLREVRIGVDAGVPVVAISPRLLIQGQYTYSVVERVLGIPNNRSNGTVEGDFRTTRRLTVSGLLFWQRTHGGLHFPAEVASFPERIAEHDRLLRDNNLRLGAGVSYSWSQWDVSATYIGYTRGSNTHAIHALTVRLGWTKRAD